MARRSSTSSLTSPGGRWAGGSARNENATGSKQRPKKKLKPQLVQTSEPPMPSSSRRASASSPAIVAGRQTPSPAFKASSSASQLHSRHFPTQEVNEVDGEQEPDQEVEEQPMDEEEEELEDDEEAVSNPQVTRMASKRKRNGVSTRQELAEEEMVEEEADGEAEEQDEGEEEDDDEEDEINSPVVFQCATCRSIIGDSYAFVGSNAELLLVTLSNCVNVKLSTETTTSREQLDLGSSYREVLCSECQTVIGRYYLTTSQPLDAIRNLYSFNTSAITSYQLGFTQLQPMNEASAATSPAANKPEDMVRNANACMESLQRLSHDRNAVTSLRDDMVKVQNLLLIVDERLHHLEQSKPHVESDEEGDLVDESQREEEEQQQMLHRRRPQLSSSRRPVDPEDDEEEETDTASHQESENQHLFAWIQS